MLRSGSPSGSSVAVFAPGTSAGGSGWSWGSAMADRLFEAMRGGSAGIARRSIPPPR